MDRGSGSANEEGRSKLNSEWRREGENIRGRKRMKERYKRYIGRYLKRKKKIDYIIITCSTQMLKLFIIQLSLIFATNFQTLYLVHNTNLGTIVAFKVLILEYISLKLIKFCLKMNIWSDLK